MRHADGQHWIELVVVQFEAPELALEPARALAPLLRACHHECKMPELVQIGFQPSKPAMADAPKPGASVLWIQGVTLAWMLVEFGVSAYSAVPAHSPAMLAFGSDSLVELLSATVVLLQWIPNISITERRAYRAAGVLLFVLTRSEE